MIKTLVITALTATMAISSGAFAAGGAGEVKNVQFSFEGPFGRFDQAQLQRGLQVYTEICSGCHGLQYVPLRTLADPGGPQFSADEVRAYAEQNFEIFDETLLDGEGDWRAATPNDHFPANRSAGAPDLSLMAKARAGFSGPYGTGINQLFKGMGGPEYIYSLLTSYTGEDKEEAGSFLYYNKAFPGGWISMAPVLYGEDVEFADGSPNDISSIAKDVSAFLMWTAEPKMMDRKQAGFAGFALLTFLSILLYLTNKRLWAPVKARAKATPAE
ncbi:MAG: cytochrome c1 [Pseudomonadota bacterium]